MITTLAARAEALRQARAAGAITKTPVERVLALPQREPPADEGAADAERWTRLLRRHPNAPPLRPVQGWTLSELARQASRPEPVGLFGAIGVGHGKTLLSLLAGEVVGADRVLLLVPPSMRDQLRGDIAVWSQHYSFEPPKVLAYSELSQPQSATALDWYAPDLIIADEAHALRNGSAARTKRFLRYFREHPTCRAMLLTGSFSDASIRDFAHLLELALRQGSPLPDHPRDLMAWASVLDADGEPDTAAFASVWPLVVSLAAETNTEPDLLALDGGQRQAREAWRLRFVRTPGVITTTEASCSARLTMTARDPGDAPAVVSGALRDLDKWRLPADAVDEDGQEIADASGVARAAGHLSLGFFYRWDWTATRYGRANPDSPRDAEWMRRRSEHASAIRGVLGTGNPDADSPMRAGLWLSKHPGSTFYAPWRAWFDATDRECDPPGTRWCDIEPPPTVTVWLSRWAIDWVVAEARAATAPLLIWYQSRAVEQALAARGLPVHGAGSATPTTDVAACSIAVHGKGKNLQRWARHIVLEVPASAQVWEQLLGRSHRQGQTAEEVVVEVLQHTPRLRDALNTAKERAAYIEQTQGAKQRLSLAAWTPWTPR